MGEKDSHHAIKEVLEPAIFLVRGRSRSTTEATEGTTEAVEDTREESFFNSSR